MIKIGFSETDSREEYKDVNVEYKHSTISLAIIDNQLTFPYNNMATLHHSEAFWAMYTPATAKYDPDIIRCTRHYFKKVYLHSIVYF